MDLEPRCPPRGCPAARTLAGFDAQLHTKIPHCPAAGGLADSYAQSAENCMLRFGNAKGLAARLEELAGGFEDLRNVLMAV